jgi:hypothetical protein
MGGGVAGLEDRILDEGQARLLGLRHTQLALGNDLDAGPGQEFVDLADLAAVIAGKDDTLAGVGLIHGVVPLE